MTEIHPKYSFRKRDYAKIRQWYDFSKSNYLPQEPAFIDDKNIQKSKQWHFTFIFKNLQLSEQYANTQMKSLFKMKQLIFLSSLYHSQKQCILSSGKQITMDCEFDATDLAIVCKEELTFYFYLQESSLKYFEFYLQIQMISNEGQLFRLGTSRYPLIQEKGDKKENIFLVVNSVALQRNKQLEDLKSTERNKKSKKQIQQPAELYVAKISFELDNEEIKEMKKYLPSFKIINKASKVAPINFNLKKKKQKITPESSFQINLQQIFFKIQDPEYLKKQLLNNNPFTLSHKDLIQFQILEYNAIIDHHNGWKFIHHKKNQFKLQLAIEKQTQIYVSSKKLNNLQINYYQCEGIVLLVLLTCQVQFRLKGVVGEKRVCNFLVGWLPLPLDLSLKQNKIELLMINDQMFPSPIYQLFNIQSVLTTSFSHPNFQKYKSKQDEKKLFQENILIDTTRSNAATYVKLKSRKNNTDSSDNIVSEERQELQTYIRAAKQFAKQFQSQLKESRFVPVFGRPQKSSKIQIHHSSLPMEQTVGKILRIKLDIDTLIPETDSPSDYYLPRCMKGTIYFMRQTHSFATNIYQKQAKYQIPIQLSVKKTTVSSKHLISTIEEFEAIMNSKLIITLYDEQAERLFAKGEAFAYDIFGAVESDKVAFVRLFRWTESSNKLVGKLLLIVDLQTQKPKETNVTVQQFQIQKELDKLSVEQRMKMRIGNFKGDQQMKTETVNALKRKKHKQYISNVVMNEQHYDGQLEYEIGMDSYFFINFTNEDKSENNVFTFHLNCVFAEIVTNQQQFRSVQQRKNLQQYNFKKLQYVAKQPAYMSYYQQKLRFNQQIGILIKLNVDQFSDKQEVLSKIQLVIKRNTLQNKRFLIRCKCKQPLVWSTIFDYGLLGSGQQNGISQNTVQISKQLLQNYTQLQILSKNVRLNSKNNTMIVSRPVKYMRILMMGKQIGQKEKRSIMYLVTFLNGRQLILTAGKLSKVNLQLQNKELVQILRCQQPEVTLKNPVRLSIQNLNSEYDLQIRMLKPFKRANFIVICYDLTGKLITQYLLKIYCQLEGVSNRMQLIYDQTSIYSINCQNPYPCSCKFSVKCSNRLVSIDDSEFKLEGYGQRLVQFKINQNWSPEHIYFYLIDAMENVCQVTEVVWKLSDVQFEQPQRELSF